MPPTTMLAPVKAALCPQSSIASLLKPFAQIQLRSASILSELSDVPSSYNRRLRLGRGPSSGKGKTSGRGQKGQKARGKVPKQFNGGQTPEGVTHGKEGFTNVHRIQLQEVNLDRIQTWIDQGRLDPTKPITLKELAKSKVIRIPPGYDGVKLLASHSEVLKTPVHIVVSRASQSAIEAVEKIGGTVTTRFYTPAAVSRIKMNVMHPYISQRWDPAAIGNPSILPPEGYGMALEDRVTGLGYQYRLPDPVSRKDLEYYRDAKNRGYLSHMVTEGANASLFWKTMHAESSEAEIKAAQLKAKQQQQRDANRLW